MAHPETENLLLRSALAAYAEGKPGAGDMARFALSSTDEAQAAYDAYQAQLGRVIDGVRDFLAGAGDDTGPLERQFERLMAMRGADSHRRCAPRDARRPRRRR